MGYVKPSANKGGTAIVAVNGGKSRKNVLGDSPRAGLEFITVRRNDGLIGHKYPDGKIVWLTERIGNAARAKEARRRARAAANPVGGAAAPS